MRYISLDDHEAIIDPDNRGRFNLRRYFGVNPGTRYRVYFDADSRTLTLEEIGAAS